MLKNQPAPTLLCDVDGVCYPYLEKLRAEVQAMFPARDIPENYDNYDPTAAWGITLEDQQKAHLSLFSGPITHGVEPIGGAPEALWELHRRGVHIIFATRRAHYTRSIGGDFDDAALITKRWLNSWAPPHRIEFVDRKADFAGAFGLLIEDNPKEARPIVGRGHSVWLLDQPYNRDALDVVRFEWGSLANNGMTLLEALGIRP